MNLNICNNCGGDYDYRHGRWVCRACGSFKPEELSNEEVTLLYTAFQKLRLANFDEAELEFDDIIEKYPENPNGYWGRLLSKYGIKYEQDFDGRMIPTCYATSIKSIIDTDDYKQAMRYADEDNRVYYQRQAEYIERVRKEWVDKAKKEKPYDIFICYKDSDLANGVERTQDSYTAQDLYVHLTKKGYRVFYSRESLRDKVGEKYEPYIFNALSTAKVLLVYGSKPSYITSTWLKNEWTRYEKRISEGEKNPNSLLVACDGFSPNELPKALSSMQCFNANDRSFYSDLDEAIEQIIYGASKGHAVWGSGSKRAKDKKNKSFFAVAIALLFVIAGSLIWNYFLKIPLCTHNKTEWIVKKQETKSKDGLKELKCLTCSKVLNSESIFATGSVGLLYKVNVDGQTCTVKGLGTCTDVQLVIPMMIDGYRVTGIESSAFRNYDNLMELVIAGDIALIGDYAFSGCSNLVKIAITGDVIDIGVGTFSDCERLDDVGLSDTLETIGSYAFQNCGALQSIVIPNSVKKIDNSAFKQCKALSDIQLPDKLTELGASAFSGCEMLMSITLPETIEDIKSGTFLGCTVLSEIKIPDKVKSIGADAFRNCSNLKSVNIPDSVTGIGTYAFGDCSKLEKLTFGDNIAIISAYSFSGCSSLIRIEIPGSINRIADGAFRYCGKLTNIRFNGTKYQWASILKGTHWNYDVPALSVICTDGQVTLE